MGRFIFAWHIHTVLPPTPREPFPRHLGQAQVYFPLVGAALGGILVGGDALMRLALPLPLVNALLLALLVLITGGLSMEGFIDTCDGIFLSEPEKRLGGIEA